MWLPTPIYEALPTVYVVVGALLLGGVFYMGFSGLMSFVYAGLGAVCIIAGAALYQGRKKARLSRTDKS